MKIFHRVLLLIITVLLLCGLASVEGFGEFKVRKYEGPRWDIPNKFSKLSPEIILMEIPPPGAGLPSNVVISEEDAVFPLMVIEIYKLENEWLYIHYVPPGSDYFDHRVGKLRTLPQHIEVLLKHGISDEKGENYIGIRVDAVDSDNNWGADGIYEAIF